MEWLTSIEGILTVVFGGVGLGTITANIVTSVKNVTSGKRILNLQGALDASTKLLGDATQVNKQLAKESENKEEQIQRMELEKLQDNETMKLILTALSYIVSAAGGIDDVTKISLLTEMDKSKNKITEKFEEYKKMAEAKAEEVKAMLEEEKDKLLETSAEKAISFLDGAKDKVQEVVNKHARK